MNDVYLMCMLREVESGKDGAQGGCQAKEGQHEGHTGHLLYMAILSDRENIVCLPLPRVQCNSFVGVFLA